MKTLFDVREYFDFESMIVKSNKFDNLTFEGVAVMSALVSECYSNQETRKLYNSQNQTYNVDNMDRFLRNHIDYCWKIISFFKENGQAYWHWYKAHGEAIREEVRKQLRS